MQNLVVLMKIWHSDLKVICGGHYRAAVLIKRQNTIIGVLSAVLSLSVGSAVIVSIANQIPVYGTIILGLSSLMAMLLTSLQTFLRFGEKSEKHRESGAKYAALLKELEQFCCVPPKDETDIEKWCTQFRQKWDNLSEESATIPFQIYKRLNAKIKNSNNSSPNFDKLVE